MSILTSRTELLTVSDLDWIHIVDVSDTTDSPQGTSKKIKKSNLFSAIGGGAWGEITGTLSAQTDLQSALNGKENTFTKNTAFNKNFGTTSGTVAQGNHTHTFASLTSKPTTISGYGITDFNSLGDARWLGVSAKAADSNLLDGIDSGSFLRSDVADTKTGGELKFNDFVSITMGTGTDATFLHDGTDTRISLLNGDFLIRDNTTPRFTFGRTTGNFTATGSITSVGYLRSIGDFPQIVFERSSDSSQRLLYRSYNDLIWRYDGTNNGVVWHSGNDGILFREDRNNTQVSGTFRINNDRPFNIGTTVNSQIIGSGLNSYWILNSGDLIMRDGATERWRFNRDTGILNSVEFNTGANTSFLRATYPQVRMRQAGATPYSDFGTGTGFTVFNAYDHTTNIIQFRANAVAKFTIDLDGNTTAAGTQTATAFYESSDRTLKTNIKEISPTFRTFERKDELGKLRYGVIAQEVETTNPELVNTDANGIKSVNYTDLLVMKVAEQENRLQEQGDKIERLEALVEQLLKG